MFIVAIIVINSLFVVVVEDLEDSLFWKQTYKKDSH